MTLPAQLDIRETTPPALTYTIVTRSHFFLAAALAENFRESNPQGRFLIVVADADDPTTGEPNWDWLASDHHGWLERISPGLPNGPEILRSARQICPADFWKLAFQYTPLELTCCLKGRVADGLMRLGETRLLYLDADTRIYDSVEHCLAPLLPQGGILLTPHLQSPLPEDECYPNNVDLLRSGVFNGGVLGFVEPSAESRKVLEFLAWWNQCNRRHCIVDPHQGLFVDQGWLDQAAAYFPAVKISRHWGLNVGYWNLHDRHLARANGQWTITPSPELTNGDSQDSSQPSRLQVFHFSGASRTAPDGSSSCHRLSRHQNRHGLKKCPELAALIDPFLASWGQHHWQHYESIPYHYRLLNPGTEITPRWREAYRLNVCQISDLTDNPFQEFDCPAGRARLEAASQGKYLKSGRFQYQLDGLHERIENLKQRLDQLPWRRLLRATQQLQKRWFKKAG